jgi:hypothetical protein
MLSTVLMLALAATMPVTPSAALESPTRHIRSTFPYVNSLLRDGFYKSPTFARLVTRLERSDLIVYIELIPQMPAGVEGRLVMLPRTHDTRYVRIQLGMLGQGSENEEIALLGHELQHASEIADAPDVSTADAFVALYERIGQRSGWHQYETTAAQDAARHVRSEIR